MRTSIGFTVLTLLASAGSSMGAPVSVQVPNTVVKANNQHHHRRSDSQSQSLVAMIGDDKPKYSNVLDMHAEAEETHHDSHHHHHHNHRSNDQHRKENHKENHKAKNKPAYTSEMKTIKELTKGVTRSRAHNARSSSPSIEMFPSKAPSQKAGLVDVGTPNSDAHVLQTPGPDRTIVDVKAGGMDAKLNLPTEDPVRDEAKGHMKDGENVFKNGGSNLVGIKVPVPLKGITNDGKAGPQGLEIAVGSNGRPSGSASASKTPAASSARPASSTPPRPSASPRSSASASASASISRSAASRSSVPPVSRSASVAARPSSSSSVPVSRSRAPTPPRSSASVSPRPASSHPSASNARPSVSKSSSSAKPSVSLSVSDSDLEFQILPGAFGATKNPGKIAVIPVISTGDSHNTNPDQSHGGITVDSGHKALDSTFGQSPKTPKDRAQPARIEFGHLPKNTIPCDGLMVRDEGEVVDLCMEMTLLDQRPSGYDACPDYTQHEFHAQGDSKKTTDKMDKDLTKLVKLCYGAGVL